MYAKVNLDKKNIITYRSIKINRELFRYTPALIVNYL